MWGRALGSHRGAPAPARRSSAIVSASKGPTWGRPSPPSSSPELPQARADLNASLLSALAAQFQRESLPWIQDLLEPLLQGPPEPLTGTEPPERLADRDSRFVDVNGVRLHYKMRAPGELEEPGTSASGDDGGARPDPDAAPALLLMHGLNGSTFSWRLLLDDLAAYVSPDTGGCRVVAYDRPPYGLSARPLEWPTEADNPYTAEGGARLAAALLDSVVPAEASTRRAGLGGAGGGRKGAVLVGHSAGAAVAVETALRYPDRVCGLVLIAPAVTTSSRGFLARSDLGQLLRFAWTRALLSSDGPGLNYVRRQVLKRRAEVEAGRLGIYADEREVPQEVIDGFLQPLRAHDWDKGTLNVYRSFQVGGTPPALDQIRVPVLVIQGTQDRAVPLEVAQQVEAAFRRRGPGCVTEMVILEGCGHVPMDEMPLDVLRAVVEFVNRECLGPASGA